MNSCITCSRPLSGRRRKFCSRACKNADTNNRHQNYRAQQQRGRSRKLELVRLKGAQCERCGYKKNYAALQFHHPDPNKKDFDLDLRTLSNRRWATALMESEKCILLCANCHAEEHNPHCVM